MLNGAEVILEFLRTQGTDCIFASPIAVMALQWEALAQCRARGAEERPHLTWNTRTLRQRTPSI